MSVGTQEIFGPVLCFKRVKTFEEGLQLMNNNPFANGSVIFTQSGYYAREFQKRTHGGMVGINVGIPVPVGVFPFSGHKQSFFGDLHCLGKDGVRFYTESKCVTSRWFDEEEAKREKSTPGTVRFNRSLFLQLIRVAAIASPWKYGGFKETAPSRYCSGNIWSINSIFYSARVAES